MTRTLTAKGEQRRDALLEAAAELVTDEGIGAVTFRSVAARAGLPLAATTYYFADRSELLVAAAARAWAEEVERAAVAAGTSPRGRGPRALAGQLVDVVVGPDRCGDAARLSSLYARVVEAARTPDLVPELSYYQQASAELVEQVLDRHGAALAPRTALALVDGVVLQGLSDGRVERGELVDDLRAALAPLLKR